MSEVTEVEPDDENSPQSTVCVPKINPGFEHAFVAFPVHAGDKTQALSQRMHRFVLKANPHDNQDKPKAKAKKSDRLDFNHPDRNHTARVKVPPIMMIPTCLFLPGRKMNHPSQSDHRC